MRKLIRIAAWVIGAILTFVLGVLGESYLRSLSRQSIPVAMATTLPAKVDAYVQPDFLWAGEQWWIDVDTDVPVVLDLDGKWQCAISPGRHKLYSDHDWNNTGEFSSTRWWKTPLSITVNEPRRSNISASGASERP